LVPIDQTHETLSTALAPSNLKVASSGGSGSHCHAHQKNGEKTHDGFCVVVVLKNEA
jgi:hypothetical protein